jgi:hypothetical protein
MSQHVSVLWDLMEIETCSLDYPKEAKFAGKPKPNRWLDSPQISTQGRSLYAGRVGDQQLDEVVFLTRPKPHD